MILLSKSNAHITSGPLFKIFGYTIRINKYRVTKRDYLTKTSKIPFRQYWNIFRISLSVHDSKSGCRALFWIIKSEKKNSKHFLTNLLK